MQKLVIEAKIENIESGVNFVKETLEQNHFSNKKVLKYMLMTEETILQMIEHADKNSYVKIQIYKLITKVIIDISCKGEDFSLSLNKALNIPTDDKELDEEQSSIISLMILDAHKDTLKFRHRYGRNYCEIIASKNDSGTSHAVAYGLVLGLIFGLLVRVAMPVEIEEFLSSQILSSITTIFLNAIKCIVIPLVFFSIAKSASDFEDFAAFGRIGSKIMITYTCTTLVALTIGYVVYELLPIGTPDLARMMSSFLTDTTDIADVSVSLKDTIINFVPGNPVAPLFEGNMIQIIVMALFVGLATATLGKESSRVKSFINAGDALMSRIMSIIIKALPLATFAITANVIIGSGIETLIVQGKVAGLIIISNISMWFVYAVLLLFVAKLNPFTFFSKFKETIIVALTSQSSYVAMPFSMKNLDKMGIASKIYSFSIPLGATINMDGICPYYLINTLFFLGVFGIKLTPVTLFTLFFMIILISMGTPAVPGAAYAFQVMIFNQLGIPAGVIGFIFMVDAIVEYTTTSTNVIGDAAVTTVVAKSENLIDIDKFNSK